MWESAQKINRGFRSLARNPAVAIPPTVPVYALACDGDGGLSVGDFLKFGSGQHSRKPSIAAEVLVRQKSRMKNRAITTTDRQSNTYSSVGTTLSRYLFVHTKSSENDIHRQRL